MRLAHTIVTYEPGCQETWVLYTGDVYMLKVTPDTQYPLPPMQEAPKAEITWWRLRQPLIVTDGLE